MSQRRVNPHDLADRDVRLGHIMVDYLESLGYTEDEMHEGIDAWREQEEGKYLRHATGGKVVGHG